MSYIIRNELYNQISIILSNILQYKPILKLINNFIELTF